MRQQTLSSKRKMDANFASTNFLYQLLGLIWRNNSQIVPKNGLLICTSNLQVKFTIAIASEITS
jgi:hypothetical protein